MVLTLLIAFFSLIALMIIHEFGHFVIAKKFGVKVEEFGIGYPPRIFGKKFGETLYSINLIPLGAFVKIYGEEGGVDDYRSFSNLPIWKRILIVLGGVIAFWIASIIIFSIVFMIGARIPIGDQDVAGINSTNVIVLSVQKDSPAQAAHLQSGDVLLQVQSMAYESAKIPAQILPINKITEFQAFVKSHGSEQLQITFLRNGIIYNTSIRPRVLYPADQGPMGVSLERVANVIQKTSFYEAPVRGVMYTGTVTWEAMKGIYKVIADFFTGKGAPPGSELAGPVGITIFLSRAADFGSGFFLYFIGSISVLLALFNVFPIPALDGGKLLFLIIEKIRKKPISERVEQSLTIVFFLLLISMSIFVTVKFDIPRVVEFWKAGL